MCSSLIVLLFNEPGITSCCQADSCACIQALTLILPSAGKQGSVFVFRESYVATKWHFKASSCRNNPLPAEGAAVTQMMTYSRLNTRKNLLAGMHNKRMRKFEIPTLQAVHWLQYSCCCCFHYCQKHLWLLVYHLLFMFSPNTWKQHWHWSAISIR